MTMFNKYPDIVDVKQLCQMLNIGKNTAYTLLADGKIKSAKIGRVYKIPKRHIEEFVRNQNNL